MIDSTPPMPPLWRIAEVIERMWSCKLEKAHMNACFNFYALSRPSLTRRACIGLSYTYRSSHECQRHQVDMDHVEVLKAQAIWSSLEPVMLIVCSDLLGVLPIHNFPPNDQVDVTLIERLTWN